MLHIQTWSISYDPIHYFIHYVYNNHICTCGHDDTYMLTFDKKLQYMISYSYMIMHNKIMQTHTHMYVNVCTCCKLLKDYVCHLLRVWDDATLLISSLNASPWFYIQHIFIHLSKCVSMSTTQILYYVLFLHIHQTGNHTYIISTY